jgi:NTE family protein
LSQPVTHQKICLALSGGGFRAALFHVGVIAALRKLGRLNDVSVLTCVSGGSIIGAYVCLHWNEFTGTDAQFDAAVSKFLEITRMDVRGRIVRRLPRRRQQGLERWLNKVLYSGALMSSVDQGSLPTLVLNATDMKHGTAAAFVGARYFPDVRKQRREDGSSTGIHVGPFPLAAAVACSAAFPAFFPARELSAKDFAQPRKMFEAGASLADGGIYDNLGVQYILGLAPKERPEQTIISDAGAPFDYQEGVVGNVLRRAVRSSSIQMEVLRASVVEDAETSVPNIDVVSITDEPLERLARPNRTDELIDGVPPAEIVRRLQLIRTDLDAFSEVESDLLIRHGFTVTVRVLAGTLSRTSGIDRVWSFRKLRAESDPATITAYSEALTASERRSLGLFNRADPPFYLPWFLLSGLCAVLVCAFLVLKPFVLDVGRSPWVDRLLTGRPYRVSQVVRSVVLEPTQLNESRAVRADSRLSYLLRANQGIREDDATFTEGFIPTYEEKGTVHGLGVIGAKSVREAPGTLPFETRAELKFGLRPGETRLFSTGVSYAFRWPGPLRSLESLKLTSDEDYWAYDNIEDYIDTLVIVVESRSNQLVVTQGEYCAVIYRGNKSVETSPCRSGEHLRPELPFYGGALIAEFNDLRPGDHAVLVYRLRWAEGGAATAHDAKGSH